MVKTTNEVPDYVKRYLNGESIQTLAQEQGIHRATLYRHMLSDLGDCHEQVVTSMLIKRIADADEKLEDDNCDIARAREMARFARMDFERRRPHLYGARPAVAVNVGANEMQVQIVSYTQQPAQQIGSATTATVDKPASD